MSTVKRASSPCVRVCILDPETGLCEGCGRTLDEIERWGSLTEEERTRIMAELDGRMRAALTGSPDETP